MTTCNLSGCLINKSPNTVPPFHTETPAQWSPATSPQPSPSILKKRSSAYRRLSSVSKRVRFQDAGVEERQANEKSLDSSVCTLQATVHAQVPKKSPQQTYTSQPQNFVAQPPPPGHPKSSVLQSSSPSHSQSSVTQPSPSNPQTSVTCLSPSHPQNSLPRPPPPNHSKSPVPQLPSPSCPESSVTQTPSPSHPQSSVAQPVLSPPSSTNGTKLKKRSTKAQPSQASRQRQRKKKEEELEDNEYEVEAILDHRKREENCEMEYLIKWKGYSLSESTWVSVSNMNCWELLQEYLRHALSNKSFSNNPTPLEKKGKAQQSATSIQKNRNKPFQQSSPAQHKETRQKAAKPSSVQSKRDVSNIEKAEKAAKSFSVQNKRNVSSKEKAAKTSSVDHTTKPSSAQNKRDVSSREKVVKPPSAQNKRDVWSREKVVKPSSAQNKRDVSSREKVVKPSSAQNKRDVSSREKVVKPSSAQNKRDVSSREKAAAPDVKAKDVKSSHLRQQEATDKNADHCSSQATSTRSLRTSQERQVSHKEPTPSAGTSPYTRITRSITKAGIRTEASVTSSGHIESPLPETNCRTEVCNPPMDASTDTTTVVYVNASSCQQSAEERTQMNGCTITLAPSPLTSPLTPSFSLMKQRKNPSNLHDSDHNSVFQFSPPASPTAIQHEFDSCSQDSSIESVSLNGSFQLHLDSPDSLSGKSSDGESELTLSDSSLTWSIESMVDSPPRSIQSSIVVIDHGSPPKGRLLPQQSPFSPKIYPSVQSLPLRVPRKTCKVTARIHAKQPPNGIGRYPPPDTENMPYTLTALLHVMNSPKQRSNGFITSTQLPLSNHHPSNGPLYSQGGVEMLPLTQCNPIKSWLPTPSSQAGTRSIQEVETLWLPPSSNGVNGQNGLLKSTDNQHTQSKQELRHTDASTDKAIGRKDSIEAWSRARLRKRSRSLSPPLLLHANPPKRKLPSKPADEQGPAIEDPQPCSSLQKKPVSLATLNPQSLPLLQKEAVSLLNNHSQPSSLLHKEPISLASSQPHPPLQEKSVSYDPQARPPLQPCHPPAAVPTLRSSPRILAMSNAHYQEQLCEWQYELNRQRRNKEDLIYVENEVDQAPTPRDFTYITSNVYGPGVPNPDNPENTARLCGCTCYFLGKKCNAKAKHCCPDMAGGQFPYTIAGKVKIPPGSPIFECNSKCSCPYDCANRVVQYGRQIPLCIFRTSNGRGWGVKTIEPIKANTFITEYVGEVITNEEAERRGRQYDKKGATYLFDLDFDDENTAFTIDAAKMGNISHFFNHSCDPNLVVYSVWIETMDSRLPRIAFFTTRNISAGEELTFDYQMNHGNPSLSSPSNSENGCIPCLCGSENCTGFLY